MKTLSQLLQCNNLPPEFEAHLKLLARRLTESIRRAERGNEKRLNDLIRRKDRFNKKLAHILAQEY